MSESRESDSEHPEDDSGPEDSALGAEAFQEVIQLGAMLLNHLKDLPVDELRGFLDDPVAGIMALGQKLGVEWKGPLEELVAFAKQRISGDFAVDEFGFDPDFTERIFLPVIRFLSEKWFRLEVRGIENVPADTGALLVANHAGALPLDAMVLHATIFDELGRHTRMLGADLVFETTYTHDLARRIGATVARKEDAARLLDGGELVSVFPEGFKGLGKKYAERYRLQRFGQGGFVSTAVRSKVPIVPVSIVGSEEIYPMLSDAPTLAKALGFPYFPVTPTFPWLGLLGMIPLPSKWIIEFGEALTTDELPVDAADDPDVVRQITDQVRITIQDTLHGLLEERPQAFF